MRLTAVADNPLPLVVAAVLALLEGLVVLTYAVLELASVSSERLMIGLTTSIFFAAYGGGLVWGAWGLTHGAAPARSPVLLAQLIQLGVAWSFWGGETRAVAIGLAVPAVVVLAGLLTPSSLDALGRRTLH